MAAEAYSDWYHVFMDVEVLKRQDLEVVVIKLPSFHSDQSCVDRSASDLLR